MVRFIIIIKNIINSFLNTNKDEKLENDDE